MKCPIRFYALALIVLFFFPPLVQAEPRYISDTLIISLRESPSLQGEVISYLRSGELLEVLEENDDGFIRVQTTTGDLGWLPKKYTIDEKPKDLIIADLKNSIQDLKAKIAAASASTTTLKTSSQTLKSQLADKDKEIAKYEGKINELDEQLKHAVSRYEDLRQQSQGVEEIVAERDNLLDRLKTSEQEVALLRVENAELIQTDRLLWFLAGFGVFLVGWIMGKVSRRSKRSTLTM